MSTTIVVNSWGTWNFLESFQVRVQDDESYLKAVLRSIKRRTGAECYPVRQDGVLLDGRGNPCRAHYQVTLTKPSKYGGYNVISGGWISIPLDRR